MLCAYFVKLALTAPKRVWALSLVAFYVGRESTRPMWALHQDLDAQNAQDPHIQMCWELLLLKRFAERVLSTQLRALERLSVYPFVQQGFSFLK